MYVRKMCNICYYLLQFKNSKILLIKKTMVKFTGICKTYFITVNGLLKAIIKLKVGHVIRQYIKIRGKRLYSRVYGNLL